MTAAVSGSASFSLGTTEGCNIKDVAYWSCGGLSQSVTPVSITISDLSTSVTSSGSTLSYDGQQIVLPW